MKQFVLKEMILVSNVEKRARKLRFDPKVTVISGDNDRGKSSLIKSIFACLGATPPMVQEKWISARVQGLLGFEVGSRPYWALMNNGAYTLFGEGMNILNATSLRVTRGFGPAFASVVDFKLKLTSKQGETIIPPPAYFLLPYYIDQDRGWTGTWCSFDRLTQFPDFKKGLAEYHAGIRPNEYYEQKAQLAEQTRELDKVSREREFLDHVSTAFMKRHPAEVFDFDVAAFRREIDELLTRANVLKEKQIAIKDKLLSGHSEKVVLEQQLLIVQHAQKELGHDYLYVTNELTDSVVRCPTCGQEHHNSFAERFGIAQDEERCVDLVIELQEKVRALHGELAELEQLLVELNSESAEVSKLLATRKGPMQLNDLLRSEGNRQVREFLRQDIGQIEEAKTVLEVAMASTVDRIKRYEDPEHRRRIMSDYEKAFRGNLADLDVHHLGEKVFRNIAPNIKESGSDLPRAILAYNFAVLRVVGLYGTGVPAPLVIDSPKQQEQDPANEQRILNFIRDKRPANSQLILGTVSTSGVDFGGTHLVLRDKFQALVADEYDEAREQIMPFLQASLELRPANQVALNK